MGEPTVGTTPLRVLAVGGSDSGGGAGLAADLRTLVACGVHASLAVTAVTVQNSIGVSAVQLVQPETVAAQIHDPAANEPGRRGRIRCVHGQRSRPPGKCVAKSAGRVIVVCRLCR
jgi:Phosphomethylpyrimidine kinase